MAVTKASKVEELQDLLSAESQILKSLPKMIAAARDSRLKFCFEVHLEETGGQVDRLKQSLDLLGIKAKAKPCKGKAGLLEEGDEMIPEGKGNDDFSAHLDGGVAASGTPEFLAVGDEMIREGKGKDDVSADLALIASGQKVEHYEISGYGTSRTMAQQIGRSDIADLLSKSLAEEENADNLLTQVSRELLSEARTGTSKLPEQLQIAEEEGEVVSTRSSSSSSAKKRK